MTEKDHQMIIVLATAGLLKKKVKFTYQYLDLHKGIRETVLLPKHFVKGVRGRANKLHIVGYDCEEEGIRQFAVSNIIKIEEVI